MAKIQGGSVMQAIPRALRFGGAGLILVNGAVHLYLWEHAYREIRVIGPLFLINAGAALLIAIALVWRPEGITALVGLAFSGGTFGAFVISVTVGLFGFMPGWDLKAVIAAIAEIGATLVLGTWWVITKRKGGAPSMGERVEG